MRFFKSRPTGAVFIALFLCWATVVQASNGFDTSRMDTSIQPCQNFYLYTNGNWLRQNPVPPANSRWASFNVLDESNRNVLKELLEAAVQNKSAKKGSVEQLIGDYYAACMDEARIEADGIKSLANDFAAIEKIKEARDLQAVIGRMHSTGLPALFGFGAAPDAKNSNEVIGNMSQGGLSLTKDYYVKDDAKSKQTREMFVKHMTNMFKLLGDDDAKAAQNAQTVLAFQTRLAKASKAPVELRDPNARYNKMTVEKLQELAPNFDWTAYFTERQAPKMTELNVGQPDFIKEVNAMLKEVSIEDWKTYLRWQLINALAPRLSSKFANENFEFFGRYLNGQKEQQPRWRRCVNATDGALGDALGQVYVKKAFPPESKARMDKLIDNLFAAYKERIQTLDWMSDETKQKALIKLASFKRRIGYPDKWRDYSQIKIDRTSYLENSRRVALAEIKRNMNKIGKPVDKTEWGFTPPTVNASYSPPFNTITFPAGILQPPFFNPEADDAINYGAIGAVIGHEITHGFDDQGSKYDADGNLKNWWTEEDRKKFDERATCVANQFSSYQVLDDLYTNGRLVLGEAIADLGGLTIAYHAFKKSMEGKPRPANIDGFTPEQRFFLGFAQVWGANERPESEIQRTKTDPHPLPRFRANGTVSNMQEFAEAFGCKPPVQMVREQACRIW